MGFCGYKYRFGLYAAHSNINNSNDAVHFHNFTITLYINRINNKLDENFEVEKAVQNWLLTYQGTRLDQTELFAGKETTVEGMGNTFIDPLFNLIQNLGYELVKLDIYENPIRVYSVSYKMLDGTVNEIGSVPIECHPTIDVEVKAPIKAPIKAINIETAIEEPLVKAATTEAVETVEAQVPTIKSATETVDAQAPTIESATETVDAQVTITEAASIQDPSQIEWVTLKPLILKPLINKILLVVRVLLGLCCFVGLAIVTMYVVKSSGNYPQGSDTFCHLYRADLILENIRNGNWFPLYDSAWYNGVEIMRYWGPIPLYIIAGLEWIAQGSILNAYILFLGVLVSISGCGWLLWGIRYKRIELSIVLGILWFYMPENMRIVIYEGNLPRGVINALLPFFFYFMWRVIEDRKKNAMWPLIGITALITLCHLGITIMLIVTVVIFVVIYSKINHSGKWALYGIGASISGVLLAGVWVVPALIGGAASGSATNQVMQSFFESALVSLNPLNRINGDAVSFYFGISILVICVIGIVFGSKNVKPGFIVAIILFLCTTNSIYTLFSKLPFSQFLWMIRFIPIGLATAMVSFIMWKQLRKWMLLLFCVMLIADCAVSIQYVYYPLQDRIVDVQADLDNKAENMLLTEAKEITNQRMAVMDLSKYGSFAPYYIAGTGKTVKYTFGAGWEGAATASNIVGLNTAVDSGWYVYLFDRALELGNDTVLIPIDNLKEKKKDVEIVIGAAKISGYEIVKNSGTSLLFHRDTIQQFGVITEYHNIAIGDSASGIAMIFPSFEEGNRYNLNDYTFEELSSYETIYLSGFTYDDKAKAEELLLKLSNSGVQIYIDMNRVPEDRAKKQMELFGVTAQSITFADAYPELEYKGVTYNTLDFSAESQQWNTIYMNGLDRVDGYCTMTEKSIPYIGIAKNDNLHFVGLNIVYYLQSTRDAEMKKLVESIFGIQESTIPNRQLVPVIIKTDNHMITIYTNEDNVNTTISSLDIFSSDDKYRTNNNLVVVDSGTTVIDIAYPHLIKGVLVTAVGMILAIFIYVRMLKLKESEDNEDNKDSEDNKENKGKQENTGSV